MTATTTATMTQAEYWNGAVGQRWARSQGVLDAVFAPLTEALFSAVALRPGERVLDLGCGSGATALIAAEAVGATGRVVAADLSEPLLAAARARPLPAGAAPVDWIVADAETHDFPAATFDRAISRFGVMFFSDSRAAFANLRRALTQQGRLSFLCWQAMAGNPWVTVPRAAVLPLVPDASPPDFSGPGPFRFADAGALRRLLAEAGFSDVSVAPVVRDLVLGRAADGSARAAAEAAAAVVVELGPVSRLLRDAEPPLRQAALEAVTETLLPYAKDGAVHLAAGCWLVSAG
ncbi:2-methoxy-6-polyprenyl-1,4-benzoquinol methylase, mitochondrial [Methylobacterium cerastii]|uniref:2-methoxy-6-polyprenyl-1,4-benzoquinol methylase, mitochondrial n=1 Tax=Methylobacterium cerastii TaxID=932741 RepID=A0ABQ4QI76_9HYPH|nr:MULTISPECIES: methyltransferase domain-containing protein [Methylobacterium]GJD44955.1 2-methoxy-6-polyprenyl-1,4-benzoquinol methylase, mitochondrial [Methylobacterium cerastii]